MGCQKEIARNISDKEADYVLALKRNQGNLYEDVRLFPEDARQKDFRDIPFSYYEETDGGHGRVLRSGWDNAYLKKVIYGG